MFKRKIKRKSLPEFPDTRKTIVCKYHIKLLLQLSRIEAENIIVLIVLAVILTKVLS